MRVGFRAVVNTTRRIPSFTHSSQFTRSFFSTPVTYGGGIGLRKVKKFFLSILKYFSYNPNHQHNYTALNNDSTPFEFSIENLQTVRNKFRKIIFFF